MDWVRILEREFPERLYLAEFHRHEIVKIDYQVWIARFSSRQDRQRLPCAAVGPAYCTPAVS